MVEDNKSKKTEIKGLKKELKSTEAKEKKAEKKTVEEAVKEIKKGKETIFKVEKEIAEKITKEDEKVKKVKENLENRVEKEDREKRKERNVEKNKEAKTESKFKKTDAVVNGRNLPVSRKHGIAICNFIRDRNIDVAISMLEDVVKIKRAVPMKGEIPHRRGRRMMSGRYPVKAGGVFIKLLKSLKSNAIVNELELEGCKITCKTNPAPRPYKRFGQGKIKRCHAEIKLVPISIEKER